MKISTWIDFCMVLVIVLTTLHGINTGGLPVALGLLYLLFLWAAWPHLMHRHQESPNAMSLPQKVT